MDFPDLPIAILGFICVLFHRRVKMRRRIPLNFESLLNPWRVNSIKLETQQPTAR